MKISSVDPRDAGWEVPHPVFRVYFWSPGAVSNEYEVADAEVHEVIDWAELKARAENLTYVLYVLVDCGTDFAGIDRFGLVQLAGRDPSSPADQGTVRPLVHN